MKDEKICPHIQFFFRIRILHRSVVINVNHFEFRYIFDILYYFLYSSEINTCHRELPSIFLNVLIYNLKSQTNCCNLLKT